MFLIYPEFVVRVHIDNEEKGSDDEKIVRFIREIVIINKFLIKRVYCN